MKLSTTFLLSVISLLSLLHPILATSDEDGWYWDDDGDNHDPKSTPRPTTTGPKTTPLSGGGGSSRYDNCIKQCPRSPQFNPICGSDNKTYKNYGMLKCAKGCGTDVDVMHLGKCPEAPSASSVTRKPNARYEACFKNCPKLPQYNPICATDGVSYNNEGLLTCAKNCGKTVEFSYRGKCGDASSELPPPTKRPRPTPTTEGTSDLDEIIFRECLNECPSKVDFKPVCGSDGVTYSNKDLFNCQVKCGSKTVVTSNGKCPSNDSSINKPDAKVDTCVKECPKLPLYNPVCGTNNITYKNVGLLNCAKSCGVDVTVSYSGSCPKP